MDQIGNWSRWLTDLFGLDDDVECEEENDYDEGKNATTLKSFHLLNALSDLMMLPKDMLLSQSIRKEVCFSAFFISFWSPIAILIFYKLYLCRYALHFLHQ